MKIFRYASKKRNQQIPRVGVLTSSENFIDLSGLYKQNTGKELSVINLIANPSINSQVEGFLTNANIKTFKIKDVELLCPLDKINSLRDAYAFRQHVATSRKNRGLEMIKEFDNFPIYYYFTFLKVFNNILTKATIIKRYKDSRGLSWF